MFCSTRALVAAVVCNSVAQLCYLLGCRKHQEYIILKCYFFGVVWDLVDVWGGRWSLLEPFFLYFGAALAMTCHHSVSESFGRQVERLKSAGFSMSVVLPIAETLLKKLMEGPPSMCRGAWGEIAGFSVHSWGFAQHWGGSTWVCMVFSASSKLCPRVAINPRVQ
uniref:Putative secreted protein n=1 Tax=Ixodes ricinus TaxID=34613 RepID=A0A6B0UY88_IXORI